MSKTPLEMVREFASVMGQPLDQKFSTNESSASTEEIAALNALLFLREKLISEEFLEFVEASKPEYILKELSDLVYVCYGYAATFGWDMDEAVRRVHQNNMERCVWPDGEIRRREDGKVLKNSDAAKIDLKDLV
jgi:predicted HAD superfamily Cof-like phosphohydrolase